LPDEHFFVSDEVRAYFSEHAKDLTANYEKWKAKYVAWRADHPELARQLEDGACPKVDTGALFKSIPAFPADAKIATRKAGADVLQPIAAAVPQLISGSADLHGSTLNYIANDKDFDPTHWTGRNIRFGIREHAMGAILNGVAYDGLFRPSGATFLVFSDYCRPSIRLAALSHLPVIYIFTHDSVGVGEDGPTHQPVETVSGLRCIPNLDVIRPGDPEETAGALVAAIERSAGPTLIALTRQAIPTLNEIPLETRREGVLKGGYIAVKETGALKAIVLASGSELQHAVAAAKTLGEGVRVVSMPCFERFDRQPADYRESVLPASCRQRVAIEAGVTGLWYKYVGLDGRVVGIDRFGLSAPGSTAMKELGIVPKNVVAAVREIG
ncbi:MAG: transketolase-like TK C-terminal-containing protein, partial [Opitutaceae bacterium]